MGPGPGEAEANRESRRGRVLFGGGVTRREAGLDAAEVEREAEAKRVSRVTLPLDGVAGGEAVGMSLENNLSRSEPVPLMVVGRHCAPLGFSGGVTIAVSTDGDVLVPGELPSVETRC
jgi:hypothetical protein